MRNILFLCDTFLAKKSIPTVGYDRYEIYVRTLIEPVVYVFFYDARLAYWLVAQKHDFDFDFACDGWNWMVHKWDCLNKVRFI